MNPVPLRMTTNEYSSMNSGTPDTPNMARPQFTIVQNNQAIPVGIRRGPPKLYPATADKNIIMKIQAPFEILPKGLLFQSYYLL